MKHDDKKVGGREGQFNADQNSVLQNLMILITFAMKYNVISPLPSVPSQRSSCYRPPHQTGDQHDETG